MPIEIALESPSAYCQKQRRNARPGDHLRFFTLALQSRFDLLQPVGGFPAMPPRHIVALALVQDVCRATHCAHLSSLDHRLLPDMYQLQGIALPFMLVDAGAGNRPSRAADGASDSV